MANVIELSNSLGAVSILRGRLAFKSPLHSSDVDYYRTGTGVGPGEPNGFTVSSGDALSRNFDSPANLNGNQDILSISVLDENGNLLSRVADGRDFAFTTAVSSNGPYYIAVQDLSDQYGVFPTGTYGLTVNVISGGALVGGNGNRPYEINGFRTIIHRTPWFLRF